MLIYNGENAIADSEPDEGGGIDFEGKDLRKNKNGNLSVPVYVWGELSNGSDLVQIVLQHADANDAQAQQTQNQVQHGVVAVSDATSGAAFGELLLNHEDTQEGQEQHQDDLQNSAVSGILNGYSFLGHHDEPVDTVDTTGYDGQQDADDNVSFFDSHFHSPLSTKLYNFYYSVVKTNFAR